MISGGWAYVRDGLWERREVGCNNHPLLSPTTLRQRECAMGCSHHPSFVCGVLQAGSNSPCGERESCKSYSGGSRYAPRHALAGVLHSSGLRTLFGDGDNERFLRALYPPAWLLTFIPSGGPLSLPVRVDAMSGTKAGVAACADLPVSLFSVAFAI